MSLELEPGSKFDFARQPDWYNLEAPFSDISACSLASAEGFPSTHENQPRRFVFAAAGLLDFGTGPAGLLVASGFVFREAEKDC